MAECIAHSAQQVFVVAAGVIAELVEAGDAIRLVFFGELAEHPAVRHFRFFVNHFNFTICESWKV